MQYNAQGHPAPTQRPSVAANGAPVSQQNYALQQQQARTTATTRPAPPTQPSQATAPVERRRVSTVALPDGDHQHQYARKRKATDTSLPTFETTGTSSITLPASVEASNATLASLSSNYSELQRIERKLDWTLARKRVEMAESLGASGAGPSRQPKVKRKLQVRVSNTCQHQLWQGAASGTGDDKVDFTTGEGVPSWSLTIEGHLLDSPPGKEIPPHHRFTGLVQKLTIDVDPSETAGTEPVHMEWERPKDSPPQDGLTTQGKSSSNLTAQISLHLNFYPERYAVDPVLGGMLGLTEASRAELISSLWIYIRKHGLLDAEDRKLFRCDEYFKQLGGSTEKLSISALVDVVNRHITRMPPVQLEYTIKVDGDPAEHAMTWDLDIETDDPTRLETARTLASMTQHTAALPEQLTKLDEMIAGASAKVRSIKARRDSLAAFSADPVTYLKVWLSSQSADIDQLLSGGERGAQSLMGVTAEDLRRSDFYKAPWLTDAINLQDSRLFGQHVTNVVAAAAPPRR